MSYAHATAATLFCSRCTRASYSSDVAICEACGAAYCVEEHYLGSQTGPPEAPCMADHGCPGYSGDTRWN